MKRLLLVALVLPVLGFTGAAAHGRPVAPSGTWILLSSDRDGTSRTYSVDANGQRLSPLFVPGPPKLVPVAASSDGRTLAYIAGKDAPDYGPLYVSRADGTHLRRAGGVDRVAGGPSFSPNGKLLAFRGKRGIWVVGANGRGLRRLTSKGEEYFDWSPNSKALVLLRVLHRDGWNFGRYSIVVKPLHGKSRIVVRTGAHDDDHTFEYEPQWSPDGRWIAYFNHEQNRRRNGLTLVHPNGKKLHRVTRGAGEEDSFQWSPDGRWLAYEDAYEGANLVFIRPNGARRRISSNAEGSVYWSPDRKSLVVTQSKGILVARGDGRGATLMRLGLGPWGGVMTWLPDSRHIAFAGSRGGDPPQIWTVGIDGTGLRRLTNEGVNGVVGSTLLAPVLPPAPPNPPTERVLDASTVSTSTPVEALSADGGRVAFVPRPTSTDCFHVVVWSPGVGLERLGNLPAPCKGQTTTGVAPLVLAGSRAAWVWSAADSGMCYFGLRSATLADPVPRDVTGGETPCKPDSAHLRGDGDLLVFNYEPDHDSWLMRLGIGDRQCGALPCSVLRNSNPSAPIDTVSGSLIALRKPGTVSVLDDRGGVVRTFAFAPADVVAARLDGGHLVVARSYTLESYDVASGALERSQQLPAGYQLADVDGGIAVLRRPRAIILLRLDTGASRTFAQGQAMYADLEAAGLYYSYATGDGGGRVVFVSRAELGRELVAP